MPIELKVPSLGESISEVRIESWLKAEGGRVEKDEPVCVMESDKATVELPAPVAGRVSKILKPAGQTALINEIIAYLEESPKEAGQPVEPKAVAQPPSAVPVPS